MLTEPLPIAIFVKTRFHDSIILGIMEKWRVEASTVERMVINSFEEMGIYSVEPALEKMYFERMVRLLKFSPEIRQTVFKAAEAERRRKQQNRHSDN